MTWRRNYERASGGANKRGAKKAIYEGIQFDSKAERDRYIELKQMAANGEITNLEVHGPPLKYVLQDKFRDRHGVAVREISYTPDFRYMESGVLVLEDVKGAKVVMSSDFPLRVKLFKRRYPDIDLYLVYMTWNRNSKTWSFKSKKLA